MSGGQAGDYNVRKGNDSDVEDFMEYRTAGGFPDWVLGFKGEKIGQCSRRAVDDRPDVYQIIGFDIKEARQKMHHGTYFAGQVERIAREEGCKEMWAWDVDDDRAEKFWKSVGYVYDHDDPKGCPVWRKVL